MVPIFHFRPCPSHLRGWEAPPLNPGSKQSFLPCDGWAQGTIIALSCLSFSVSVSPSLLSSRVWVLTCLRGWIFEGQSTHALRGAGGHSVALPLGRFICLQSPECSPARSEEQPRVSSCVNKWPLDTEQAAYPLYQELRRAELPLGSRAGGWGGAGWSISISCFYVGTRHQTLQ